MFCFNTPHEVLSIYSQCIQYIARDIYSITFLSFSEQHMRVELMHSVGAAGPTRILRTRQNRKEEVKKKDTMQI